MQRLVIGRLVDDARGNHGLKSQFNTCFDHGDHENALIVVGLLVNFLISQRLLFKRCGVSFSAPSEQVHVIVSPVRHHGRREVPGHNVVLVLFEQGTQHFFHVFCKIVGAYLGGVGQTIHHVGDAAVLQTFGNGFPAVLNQFGRIARLYTQLHHAIEAEQ